MNDGAMAALVGAGLVGAAAVAVIVLLLTGVLRTPDFIVARFSGAAGPEHSARYYPPGTLAYQWLTLAPGGGQLSHSRELLERLDQYSAFEDWVDDSYEALEDATGIDLEADVMPWIGPDFSAALLEWDAASGEFDAAVTIGVRDREAAADFLDDWLDYLESESGRDFRAETVGAGGDDFEVWAWTDWGSAHAYALSSDLLVFATSRRVMDEVLERLADDDRPSLADEAAFQQARDALPERRFTSLYFNFEPLLAQWQELADAEISLQLEPAIEEILGAGPHWAALSMGWIERGLTLEAVYPAADGMELLTPALPNPAQQLPSDTLAYAALSFDPALDNWRRQLREYTLTEYFGPDAGLAELRELNDASLELARELGLPDPPPLRDNARPDDLLDLGLWYAEELTGVDLETEFLDYLGGELILSLAAFDFAEVAEDPERYPIDAAALLSYREGAGDGLAGALRELANLAEDELDLDYDRAAVGAERDAIIFDLPETRYDPGYLLLDHHLALASTEEALAELAAVASGQADNLASMDEHRRAMQPLPERRQLLAYINLGELTGQLDAVGLEIPRPARRLLRDLFGALAAAVHTADGHARAAAVLTLFPE